MNKNEVQKIVKYWQATAAHDYKTMISLFESKRYSDSLFFGHIILEKILKGLVVKNTKEQAPYSHDLVRLQRLSGIELPEEQLDLLDRVNDFNLRARYPEYKLQFYKLCTKKYTKNYFDKIDLLYKKLCQELKRKK